MALVNSDMMENSAAPIPPLQNYTLDLRTLTQTEEETLRQVLERDAQEMEILDNRISLIRKEIQDIRIKGALVEGDHQNTMCARCKHKFWLIPLPLTDRGVRCIKCKFRICARCRFKQINKTWLCVLCLKYRQEKVLSGEWMFKAPVVGLFGSDLMRASLRDKGRKKRRSPATSGNTSLVNSTSESPHNLNQPIHDNKEDGKASSLNAQSERASSPSGQRRDSYSKALENQKIRVILPKGNDDDVDGRARQQEDSVKQADGSDLRSTLPSHVGKEELDESDKESINSSLSSHSSIRPISKNASTNSSFSSRSSSKSMPAGDNHRARQHSDSSSIHHISEGDDAYSKYKKGTHSHYDDYDDKCSLHSGGGGGQGDNDCEVGSKMEAKTMTSAKSSARGAVASGHDSSSERKNSFEEIYDSNVNRLVKMMTAGQVSDSDLSFDDKRPSHRLLPRPPDSGKENHHGANDDNDIDEKLLEKRLSLTEELQESLKYLNLTEGKNCDGFGNDVSIGDGGMSDDNDNDTHVLDNDNRVHKSEEYRVNNATKITHNDDKSEPFVKPLNNLPSGSETREEQIVSLLISDEDIDDVINREDKEATFATREHIRFLDGSDTTSNGSQSMPTQPQDGLESFSLEDQNLMLSYLRTPENDVPYEFKVSLSRNDSNASDALSRITEVSEPCGEADSLNSREGSDSDDTLNGDMDASFSDDDGVMNSSKSSVINVLESTGGVNDKNVQKEAKTKIESLTTGKSNDGNKYTDNNIKDKDGYSHETGYYNVDEDSISAQDDSGIPDTDRSEASTIGSEDSGANLPSLDEPVKSDVSFSSSVLSEFDLDKDPEVVLTMAMAGASTPTPADSVSDTFLTGTSGRSKDPEESNAKAENKGDEEVDAIAKSKDGKNRMDSVRDSDSGVNSSHTSRANTPEQRSLSSGGDKGANLNTNSSSRSQQVPLNKVPTIAVEEAGEEEDDLDELFNQHRPPSGSNLSARSSLRGSLLRRLKHRSSTRDSRESLYSVYSAAGEEHYGDIPVTGEIMFNLEYNYKTGMLSIHVKQCKDLAPVDTKKMRSDPYVKTYLMPDKTRSGKRKTKIKRHTLNPTYNETLSYIISKTELESRSLWISVWNNDRFGRNDFLGEVTVPLDYYEFDKSTPIWYALQDRQPSDDSPAMTYKGDLFISLKYVPASMVSGTATKKRGSLKKKDKTALKTGLGEVHIMVKEAQNLTAMRSNGGSNPFCKGYLLPDETHHSKQKTPVLKKTTNPNWQHLLVFEGVDETELENHGVELTVWDHETLSSNDFLGGVRLNTGTGYIRGKATDWMDARGEEIEAWQRMVDRHNEWVDIQLPLRASMGKQK